MFWEFNFIPVYCSINPDEEIYYKKIFIIDLFTLGSIDANLFFNSFDSGRSGAEYSGGWSKYRGYPENKA